MRRNHLTESDLYKRIILISKLKLINILKCWKDRFIFDVTYVMKSLNFKLNKSKFKHFKKIFEK